MTRICCLVVAALVAAATGAAEPREVKLPDAARAALDKADQIEVLSLDPDGGDKSKDAFHGYKVLGKTPVAAEDARTALTAAVLKGVAESEGSIARCFEPRHGLRAVHDGKTYDFVICFHCFQIQVFAGEEKLDTTPTTVAARPALDKILKDAGVPVGDDKK